MERFQAAVLGQEVDRLPISIWVHFASEHLSGDEVAALHLRYFRTYDWDFLKFMHDYRYPLPGIEAVASAADLDRFTPLSPDDFPLSEQLAALQMARKHLGPEVPIIETLFSPWQTLMRMAGASAVQAVLAHPAAGAAALEAVTKTLCAYVGRCAEIGVDGIFFSVNGASQPKAGGLETEVFRRFAASFDRRVLAAAAGLTRIAHIHGYDLDFARVQDYPAEVFNWSHHHTEPSLTDVLDAGSRAVIGGIDETKIARQTPAELAADIRRAVAEVGTKGLLIGPGCTVPPDTPQRILRHAVQAVRGDASPGA